MIANATVVSRALHLAQTAVRADTAGSERDDEMKDLVTASMSKHCHLLYEACGQPMLGNSSTPLQHYGLPSAMTMLALYLLQNPSVNPEIL